MIQEARWITEDRVDLTKKKGTRMRTPISTMSSRVMSRKRFSQTSKGDNQCDTIDKAQYRLKLKSTRAAQKDSTTLPTSKTNKPWLILPSQACPTTANIEHNEPCKTHWTHRQSKIRLKHTAVSTAKATISSIQHWPSSSNEAISKQLGQPLKAFPMWPWWLRFRTRRTWVSIP